MATTTVFVYTMNQGIQGGAWSRYIFPFIIEHFAHLGNSLYLRSGDAIHRCIEGQMDDNGTPFVATIQWPWLEFGSPGRNKMLEGIDIVGKGASSVSIGYDQQPAGQGTFTTPVLIPEDTIPGYIIAIPVNAPSMSVKLTYDGTEVWEWQAMNMHLLD